MFAVTSTRMNGQTIKPYPLEIKFFSRIWLRTQHPGEAEKSCVSVNKKCLPHAQTDANTPESENNILLPRQKYLFTPTHGLSASTFGLAIKQLDY